MKDLLINPVTVLFLAALPALGASAATYPPTPIDWNWRSNAPEGTLDYVIWLINGYKIAGRTSNGTCLCGPKWGFATCVKTEGDIATIPCDQPLASAPVRTAAAEDKEEEPIGCLDKIIAYAIWDKWIVGVNGKGYFIVDVDDPILNGEDGMAFSKAYWKTEDWIAARRGIGIPDDLKLLRPDEVAKSLPDLSAHPWKCRIMRCLFGYKDAAWFVFFFLTAFGLAFILGLLLGIRVRLLAKFLIVLMGLPLGWFVFLTGDMMPPGILIPVFILYLLYRLGRAIRNINNHFKMANKVIPPARPGG